MQATQSTNASEFWKPGDQGQDAAAGSFAELSHDASNLLSALGLYGELLGLPGVLHTPHRHYAEDLKLLAARSQGLIGRLGLLRETAEPIGSARGTSIAPSILPAALPAVPTLPYPVRPRAFDEGATRADLAEGTPLQPTSLRDLLVCWEGLLSTLARGALAVDLDPGGPLRVPVAERALERILINLVRNAAEAIREGGAIRIGASVLKRSGPRLVAGGPYSEFKVPDPEADLDANPGHTIVLTVDDTGCGMSESRIEQALSGTGSRGAPAGESHSGAEQHQGPEIPLARSAHSVPSVRPVRPVRSVRSVRGQRSRHGLGLQIVRDLVAESGGDLRIQSWPGRGTRVEIRWPSAPGAVDPLTWASAGFGDSPSSFSNVELRILTGASRRSPVDHERVVVSGQFSVDGAETAAGATAPTGKATGIGGAIAC